MAKRFYCTLFDSFYLPRGLALLESLNQWDPDFHLYIFAFDENTLRVLQTLKPKNATAISLQEFETPELLSIKPTRSKVEYCWTSTPATILHCLEKFNLPHCTYLDADLLFYQSPEVLLKEMGDKDVLITDHRYSPQNRTHEITSGKYCVQFMTFKNSERGMKVLRWWKDRCIEWCFDRHEDGKFGDQKYLDDWMTRFEGVHDLQYLGGGIAPWNADQFSFSKKSNGAIEFTHHSTGTKDEAIFYHFHGLKFFDNETLAFGAYSIANDCLEAFYRPYVGQIRRLEKNLTQLPGFANYRPPRATAPTGFVQKLRELKRILVNRNRSYPIANFVGS